METKNIVERLRFCANENPADCGSCNLRVKENGVDCYNYLKLLAAERLEDLEKQLDEQKEINKQFVNCCIDPKEGQQPEWISIEDRVPELNESVLGVSRETGKVDAYVFLDHGLIKKVMSHWMPFPEPPKPKEPTFKDVFLKAFPRAPLNNEGHPKACLAVIFGGTFSNCVDCFKCWNRPYFEEEGGEE